MKSLERALPLALAGVLVWFSPTVTRAADVRGYSILKGQFLIQTGPEALITDPTFGFSILASVELTDFDLVTDASLRLPDGSLMPMDDLFDSWSYLDCLTTYSSLNADYGWGNYTIDFSTVNEGEFSCVLSLPSTPLPPAPRLTNFADIQAVNPTQPLTLSWDFPAPPKADDFVQVYITLGHGEAFSTPDLGTPGALDGTARSVTVPADTLAPGFVYSLNLEITRFVSTNSSSYADAEGVTGTFSSTSLDLTTVVLPELQPLSPPTNGLLSVEVLAEPGKTIILQGSDNLSLWRDLATNTAPSGSNLFTVATDAQAMGFFRALQR